MIVMKFGGSSVASAQCIQRVALIIQKHASKKPVVILSAMGDTTDHLLEAADNAVKGNVDISKIENLHYETATSLGVAKEPIEALLVELKALLTGISMLKELTKRTRDYLVSFGERLSVRMMAEYLVKEKYPAQFYDAWDIGFISDSKFTNAELLDEVWDAIPAALNDYKCGKQKEIPVVTGFIAKDTKGHITTLGRGGSDLSATIVGAAMKAEEVQTWKDVDGILTADPRIVTDAKNVPIVTYDEAAELAYFGAQVLHPRAMYPVKKTGTPVRVKNSYNIEHPGSLIVAKHSIKPLPVRAISMVKDIQIIDIVSTRMLGSSGFLAHIFTVFLKWKISIDVIATSEVSVSLTVAGNEDIQGLLKDLNGIATCSVQKDKAIVTIICDAAHSSAIVGEGLLALAKTGVNPDIISQGASKVNISIVCDMKNVNNCVKTLHKAYFNK
ncbi:MAG TPA: aspartate kinase [Treponemataceae bacterium]|nr:aspartate kinase [Treponemataceae bacterium]